MNKGRKVLATLCILVAPVAVAACGGNEDELLPGENAQEILTNLENVEQLASEGACDEAISAIDEINAQVQSLPSSVSDQLRRNLRSGVERLREVTEESCGTDVDQDVEGSDPDVTEPETTEEQPADQQTERGSGREPGGGTDTPTDGDRARPGEGDRGNTREPSGPDEAPTTPSDRGNTPNPPGGGAAEPPPVAPETPDSGGITPGEAETGAEGTQ